MEKHPYKKLYGMLLLSFVIMYAVMFLNVDETSHIYLSLTRLYMTLLMVSPMAMLMIVLMGKMYPDRIHNKAIIMAGLLIFTLSFLSLRKQVFVSDDQYMKAMIPHHSSAIMTSKHATILDPEVKELSKSIIESQEREIEQMKHILQRMEK